MKTYLKHKQESVLQNLFSGSDAYADVILVRKECHLSPVPPIQDNQGEGVATNLAPICIQQQDVSREVVVTEQPSNQTAKTVAEGLLDSIPTDVATQINHHTDAPISLQLLASNQPPDYSLDVELWDHPLGNRKYSIGLYESETMSQLRELIQQEVQADMEEDDTSAGGGGKVTVQVCVVGDVLPSADSHTRLIYSL